MSGHLCVSCGFEWTGERETCPACRASFVQPSMFDVESKEVDVERINEATADPETEWVGLPEFVPVGEPFKVVVSTETEAERDELLRHLGISTVHKGTRGTLSVWWPDRPKEDLSSLRFETVEEPEEDGWESLWEEAA